MRIPFAQNGFILIQVLLFTGVLFFIFFVFAEKSVAEKKEVELYRDKLLAFEGAESGLKLGEAEIRGEVVPDQKTVVPVNYRVTRLRQDSCGKKWYLIAAQSHYRGAKIALEAVYEWLPNARKPSCRKERAARRIFWGVI